MCHVRTQGQTHEPSQLISDIVFKYSHQSVPISWRELIDLSPWQGIVALGLKLTLIVIMHYMVRPKDRVSSTEQSLRLMLPKLSHDSLTLIMPIL